MREQQSKRESRKALFFVPKNHNHNHSHTLTKASEEICYRGVGEISKKNKHKIY